MSGAEAVQTHDDTSTCDTLHSSHVPIVFVPGVMGSRIAMSMENLTWDPDSKRAMFGWFPFTNWQRHQTRHALTSTSGRVTTLDELCSDASDAVSNDGFLQMAWDAASSGGSSAVPVPLDSSMLSRSSVSTYYGKARNWASVAWGFYGAFLMALEARFNRSGSHPVYAFGYDWRASNGDSGRALNAFIRNVLSVCEGAPDVVVVTHSMGGLVARGGIQQDASITSKIRGVVHGAQPSNGAVVCFRRFFTGCAESLEGGANADTTTKFLNRVMGTTPERFAYNLSGCRGPVELLPNHVYQVGLDPNAPPWLSAQNVTVNTSDIYATYLTFPWPGLVGCADAAQKDVATWGQRWDNTIVADMINTLNSAKQFHLNVAGVAHDNTLVVYSDGLATDVGLTFGPYAGQANTTAGRSTGAEGYPPGDVGPFGLVHDSIASIHFNKLSMRGERAQGRVRGLRDG